MATLKSPKYRRLKGANSDVEIEGNLVVTGTVTSNATVDGSGAVVLADDFSAAGTSKDPLIATDMSADKISFFGATLASQQSDSGALTVADGAGTNDGTIGAITGDASVIAAVQELAAKINALRTALRNLGLMA